MKALILVCVALFSMAASAKEMVSVQAELGYPATEVQSWTYAQSHSVVNGVEDHQAYVWVRFMPAYCDQKLTTSHVMIPVHGLVWDAEFKQVQFMSEKGAAPVVCAKKRMGGIKKYEDTCSLNGQLRSDFGRDAE